MANASGVRGDGGGCDCVWKRSGEGGAYPKQLLISDVQHAQHPVLAGQQQQRRSRVLVHGPLADEEVLIPLRLAAS